MDDVSNLSLKMRALRAEEGDPRAAWMRFEVLRRGSSEAGGPRGSCATTRKAIF